MPGVWRAVAHSEGAAVIYHSPKACGHVTRDMGLGGHYHSMARQAFVPGEYIAPLVTSNLQEEHSIFGGADHLRGCIDFVMERYAPQYVMIANSCVAGVIGDDTEAIARDAERAWNIPVMTVPCYGFLDGEYHAGYYHAAKALADRFMEPQPVVADTVTLLGDRGGPSSPDAKEIADLLNFFGLKVHCHFPGYASPAEIRRVPASTLCIPLGGGTQSYSWVRRLAGDLQERFGMPFFDCDYPAGWQGTRMWIRKLGVLLDREREASLAEAEQENRLQSSISRCREALQAAKVVLCLGRPLIHFQPDWVLELLAMAEAKLEGIVLYDGLTVEQNKALRQELNKLTAVPVLDEDEGESIIDAADLLVTTHELEDEAKRQFFLPVLPLLGARGQIELLNKLARLARRPGRQGGVLYGW